jgi:hypothetical protein
MPEDDNNFDVLRLPKRSSWSGVHSLSDESEIDLPWTKTTHFSGDTIFLTNQRAPLNATHALRRHFEASPLGDDDFLCEYVSKGRAKFLSRHSLMAMCNSIWSAAGLGVFTGHSFRIGGTTALLCSGVAPDMVKKMGRWSSDTFLIYWRSLGQLFARHAANLHWQD